VERYSKEAGLFRTDETPDPAFTETLSLDMGTVEPSVAGPKRPQDRVRLRDVKEDFDAGLSRPTAERGFALASDELDAAKTVARNGDSFELKHGAVIIAAITSCTNTSNPSVMLGAGLLAKNAVEAGITTKPWVKTSLAPGSKVVTDYLGAAGLTPFLEELKFHTVGYGCTTCIGNSGPLEEDISEAVEHADLVAAAVLSGNRNFEGRINPYVKANYLASPALVVAYSLAGRVDIDFEAEPLGESVDGKPVYLRDVWPSQSDIRDAVAASLNPDMFVAEYGKIFDGDEQWAALPSPTGDLYDWDENSTYIQEPPFFDDFSMDPPPVEITSRLPVRSPPLGLLDRT